MDYSKKANEIRKTVLKMVYKAQSSHIGSNFSAIDILTVLYDKMKPEDEFICSKGWIAATVYAFLADKGEITQEQLDSYCVDGSKFIGLLEPNVTPSVKCAGGSMGYGLPFGVGMALAKKIKGEKGTVYVLMSDGEQAIGTTWESALIAAKHGLDNLVVLVDKNGLQAMGKTEDILPNVFPTWAPNDKRRGWNWRGGSGHDFEMINTLLNLPDELKEIHDQTELKGAKGSHLQPTVLVFDTIKGKGVKEFEGNNDWHYRNIPEDVYLQALKELT